MSHLETPAVIGATGGSGSRVVVRILQHAGYFMGTNLNEADDSQEFPILYDRWVNRYVLRRVAPLCREEEQLLLRDFLAAISSHRSTIPRAGGPWGWKEPRSIYLLPFLDEHWPGTKFIHVIRDGRDMAFSTNQNQLRKHGLAVLGSELADAPDPVRSAVLWAQVNMEAASYGEARMQDRYLRVKFESLCSNPEHNIRKILDFLGLADLIASAEMVAEVSPPQSIGRWRTMGSKSLIESISSDAGTALRRFGYIEHSRRGRREYVNK